MKVKVKWKSFSHVQLFTTPWTVACQAPLSMEFSKQKYWSELPFPFPGDLLYPGIEFGSPALQADSLPSEPPGKTKVGRSRYYFTKMIGINPELHVTFPPPKSHLRGWGEEKKTRDLVQRVKTCTRSKVHCCSHRAKIRLDNDIHEPGMVVPQRNLMKSCS